MSDEYIGERHYVGIILTTRGSKTVKDKFLIKFPISAGVMAELTLVSHATINGHTKAPRVLDTTVNITAKA